MDTQKLKDKILQLAIQGKLVEQDPSDEPASELLKKIEAEKKKLYKEGKIRKPKKLLPIKEEEKPFDIPKSWEWVRAVNICYRINYGFTAKAVDANTGTKMLRITDIQDGKVNWNTVPYCKIENSKINRYVLNRNDIIIARTGGTVGKSFIVKEIECQSVYASYLIRLLPSNKIYPDYFYQYLQSPYYWSQLANGARGGAQPNVNSTILGNLIIPLPPINEQKRIVEKIDELFILIDKLDSDKEKLLETIELTRKKVLQDAIQGKLVEQNPDDEPASELLKKIEAEKKKLYKEGKIRKPKKLPPIKDEEKPFEIPESWEWVRLGNICYKLTDGSHNPPKGIDGRGYPMISAVNINKKIDFTKPSRIISKKDFEKEHRRTNISKNDILLTTVGTIGRTIVVETNKQFTVQRSVAVVNTGLYPHYVKLFFNSPFFYNQMINNAKGTAQLGIYLGKLSNLIVCCSPLEEQKKW